MARYFIELSYRGKNYHGWQKQKNAMSVQSEIDKALGILLGHEAETVGCGRTDTGVHANQFYAHFNTEVLPENELFLRRMNALLPADVAVKNVFPVDPSAHARFDATSRSYVYAMYFRKNPFYHDFAVYFRERPSVDAMNAACTLLLEHQDFSCFSKSNTQVKTNFCAVYKAEWREEGEKIFFFITADRFLRNMVRAIVGTVYQIGLGTLSVCDFKAILASKDRSLAGASVPAHGLTLTEVTYPFTH